MSHAIAVPRSGPLSRWSPASATLIARFAPETAIFLVAFLLRVWVVTGDGGFSANYFYDPAVYYGAADALTHGLRPYHDFVLVHPPLIALVTIPFALLGRLTTDHHGFIAANIGYTALAALNAVLVIRVAQRFGVARRAALIGGAFYAVWVGAIGAEFLVRLEPLGNFFVLVSLLALAAARRSTGWRAPVGCGVLLACAVSVKLWFAVPVVIVLLWELIVHRAGRRTGLLVLGVLGGAAVIDGPFLLLSGHEMYNALVTAQSSRPPMHVSLHLRLDKFTGVSQAYGYQFNHDFATTVASAQVLVVAVAALVVTCCAFAARSRDGRLWVTMLACQLVVSAVVQVWFYTYNDYLAVPLALVVAAAAGAAVRGRRTAVARTAVAAVLTTGTAILTVVALAGPGLGMVPSYQAAPQLARAVAHRRCLVADTPMNLVELNALDRSFDPGCRNIVDLIGFELGGADMGYANYVPANLPRLGRYLCRYFTSGDAVMIDAARIWRALPRTCARRIRRSRVLITAGGHTIYALRR